MKLPPIFPRLARGSSAGWVWQVAIALLWVFGFGVAFASAEGLRQTVGFNRD
ncbi:MAG: hypothetical protein ABI273_08545 [Lacunisphaera sp.]